MRYNLACALTINLKDNDGALSLMAPWFDRVLSATMIKHLEADPDMEPIRGDPRFQAMLGAAKKRLGISA
jgi:adenylate cyclase